MRRLSSSAFYWSLFIYYGTAQLNGLLSESLLNFGQTKMLLKCAGKDGSCCSRGSRKGSENFAEIQLQLKPGRTKKLTPAAERPTVQEGGHACRRGVVEAKTKQQRMQQAVPISTFVSASTSALISFSASVFDSAALASVAPASA